MGEGRSVGGMRAWLRANLSDHEESDESLTRGPGVVDGPLAFRGRAGSSVGQSSGLIIRQTKVRVLPGPSDSYRGSGRAGSSRGYRIGTESRSIGAAAAAERAATLWA